MKPYRTPLLLSFVVALFVAVVHIFGMTLSWYWLWKPLDAVMHLLAGVSMGLFAYWVFIRLGAKSHLRLSIFTTLFALAVGISWEFFEFFAGIAVFEGQSYWPDTALDLFLDLAGALAAAHVSHK